MKVESEDPLLGRIESILNGRVGGKPEDSVIKNIMNLGKERYKTLTPPGYKDAGKEKEPDNKYIYGGINYERQFGDLIVWQQIIQYAKEEGKKHLIFVTDDSKEDWWQKMQGKTIGFRNELIDEIYSKTGLHLFNAYFLGGFLTSAQKYLKEDVSEKTIGEVNESSKTMNIDDALTEMEHRPYSSALEDAVTEMEHRPYSSALEDAVAKMGHHPYLSALEDAVAKMGHHPYSSALEDAVAKMGHHPYSSALEDVVAKMGHHPYSSALEDAVAKMGHHPYSSALEDAVAKIEPHSYSLDKDDDK